MGFRQETNDPIIGKLRKGFGDDPYIRIVETLQVMSGKAHLSEIPEKFDKVIVTGALYPMQEVLSGELSENTYRVDYANGVVFFHSDLNAQYLMFQYKGRGAHFFPSTRVYLKYDNILFTVENKFQDVDRELLMQAARVNNLINANPQPSEIVDIRVDYFGKVHSTAKTRIDALQKTIHDASFGLDGKAYGTLKSRLDYKETQINTLITDLTVLNEKVTTEVARIDLTIVNNQNAQAVVNESVSGNLSFINDSLKLAKLNSINLSKYFKKMQNANTAPIGNDVLITCQGDSLTEGNGATVGGDYPSKIKQFLGFMARHGQTIEVINRGVGGDTTKMSYEHWPNPSGGDLCIIFLGTNDYNKNITMTEFADYYEKNIQREIVNGTGVILVTPPKWRKSDWLIKENNGSLTDYVAVIKDFGNQYNAPVLDLFAESKNLNMNAYKSGEADPGIHLSDVGYQMVAQKLCAMIGIQHPSTVPGVHNNTFLGVRPAVDGIKLPRDYYILHRSESYPSPPEYGSAAEGVGLMAEDRELEFYYSIYAEEDNLAFIPSFFFTKSDGSEMIEILINNNNLPIHPNNEYQYNQTLNRALLSSRLTLNMGSFPKGHVSEIATQSYFKNPWVFYYRVLPTKGWYTLKIRISNCRFHGLDIINSNQLKLYRQLYYLNPGIVDA